MKKQLFALFLSLCVALSLAVPAFAAEVDDATNPGTVIADDEIFYDYEEEYHGVCTACQKYFQEYWEMMAEEMPDEIEASEPVAIEIGEGEDEELIVVETGGENEPVETATGVSEILLDTPVQGNQPDEGSTPSDETNRSLPAIIEIVPEEIEEVTSTSDPATANFATSRNVRLVGDTVWYDYVDAKVGDLVECQVKYKNTDADCEIHENVTVKAVLPENLEFVPGSVVVYTAANPNGLAMDESIEDGICIGNFARNANAYVRYTLKVVDNNLNYGTTSLVDWTEVSVGQTTVFDFATVNVTKTVEATEDGPSEGYFEEEPVVGGGYWNPRYHSGWAYYNGLNEGWACDVNYFLAENPALREAAGTYFQKRGTSVNIEISADYYAATMTGSNGRTVTVYNWHCDSDLRAGNFELIPGTDNDGNHILLTVYSEESLYRISTGSGDTFCLWAIRPQAEELCERLGLDSFVFCFETRGRLVSNVLAWLVKSPDGDYVVRMAR